MIEEDVLPAADRSRQRWKLKIDRLTQVPRKPFELNFAATEVDEQSDWPLCRCQFIEQLRFIGRPVGLSDFELDEHGVINQQIGYV